MSNIKCVRYKNPHFHEGVYWAAQLHKVQTGNDGNFEIAVMPGPAHLLVETISPEFIRQMITYRELDRDTPGGMHEYYHGFIQIEPSPASDPIETAIDIHRGVTIAGNVVGPQGEPVKKAILLSDNNTKQPGSRCRTDALNCPAVTRPSHRN